jgi:hypothetical protein
MDEKRLEATARYIVAAASGESAMREALMPNIDETLRAADAFERIMRPIVIQRQIRIYAKPTTKKIRRLARNLGR